MYSGIELILKRTANRLNLLDILKTEKNCRVSMNRFTEHLIFKLKTIMTLSIKIIQINFKLS